MDFRLKCAVQHAISAMPFGPRLYSRLTKRALPEEKIRQYERVASRHLAAYWSVHGRHPRRILELGSGRYLRVPMALAAAGCDVVATDVDRNAQTIPAGVAYIAPYHLDQPASTFDMVVSNDVLEHVLIEELPSLLAHCRTLLKVDGLCSFYVNYGDHWARGDSSIGVHNFLRYSESTWALLNPPLQFQNRLRHSDYLRAFSDAGLVVRSEEHQRAAPPSYSDVHKDFRRYSRDELAIVGAWFTLSKRPARRA